jgi:AcrR family transcriptional regulator
MRTDRRVQKTHAAIMQAFEKLLMKKSYDAITIQDIIDEANIGRSTFYAHFETKDSLLEAICSGLFDHIFADHLNAEPGHDFSGSEEDVEAKIIHTLYHLQEDRKRLSRIFSCESAGLFWEYFQLPFSAEEDGIDLMPDQGVDAGQRNQQGDHLDDTDKHSSTSFCQTSEKCHLYYNAFRPEKSRPETVSPESCENG